MDCRIKSGNDEKAAARHCEAIGRSRPSSTGYGDEAIQTSEPPNWIASLALAMTMRLTVRLLLRQSPPQ
jgi:hypothetical protein